ncbi:hypothetical protein N0B44_26225 [Roseibacterium beibuensis]|uniref:hypothetical protein n=1 Tax=[Roseibacterium] beibuensis TaxID=1193142 RepID=UPI00217CDDE2|nr:hypothetical protein [Roseibacterium beibuensis]MCS6626423.1 hypothetical protein [Roseibacterium beibuensis]
MTISRLSEIDLARFCAVEDDDMLRHDLRRYNLGGGSWSYDPVRRSKADLLAARVPALGPLPEPTWLQLQKQIIAVCHRGPAQAAANCLVGKTLFDYRSEHRWDAVKLDMGFIPLGFGESVRYWSDVVVDDGKGPLVAFFDHRREGGVHTPGHRRIVNSMQHVWIRERHLDLASARLAVIRFPSQKVGRSIDIQFHEDADLLDYDALDAAVKRVYRLWAEVSRERSEAKKAGSGGTTPLGF